MTTLIAIETNYAGCRFRSRLEARWAVFFDAVGIGWQYELQGYKIPMLDGSTRGYLPDFWLPGLALWCEVKGNLEADDLRLLILAASGAGLPPSPSEDRCPPRFGYPRADRLLILGDVPDPAQPRAHARLDLVAEDLVMAQPVFFAKRFGGHANVMPIGELVPLNQYLAGEEPHHETLYTLNHGRPMPADFFSYQRDIAEALRAGRSARFEHGESGAPTSERLGAA